MPKCSILTHVQFALRWRTEEEVLSGTGESSCGNTRCKHHNVNSFVPSLSTLELPFAYEEQGETKSALVKTVLCNRCVKKLMWKRQKEKKQRSMALDNIEGPKDDEQRRASRKRRRVEDDKKEDRWEAKSAAGYPRGSPRRSRSRSPPPGGRPRRSS